MSYATVPDVETRCRSLLQTMQAKAFTTVTAVTSGDVQEWISDATVKINKTLAAGGLTMPVTQPDQIEILQKLVVTYAAGMVNLQWAQSAGTLETSPAAEMLEEFKTVLEHMRTDPSYWSRLLFGPSSGGGGDPVSKAALSHVTYNSYRRPASDFAPKWTRDSKL